MTIRPMQTSDFESVCSLWRKINIQPESVIKDQDNFDLMLQLNPSTCFIAEEDGQVIGSVFGLFNGRRAWIHHLGVHPAWQKKGLGTKLLQKTEESLQQKGAKRVLLSIDLQNLQVIPFYEEKGYSITLDAITFAKNL